MEEIRCPFCGEDVTEAISPDALLTCPRCHVVLLLTSDEDEGEARVRNAVSGAQNIDTDDVQVVVVKGVTTRDGHHLHLIAGWNPEETLRVPDVASILGVSRYQAWRYCTTGAFPNASKGRPSRRHYDTGIWLIPRKDVQRFLLTGRRSERREDDENY